MNKILTLFALSAISAAVMAEGTIQTQPQQIMPYAPFAPVYSLTPEQQQAMFEQRNKAAQEAFEARRQLFEQVAAEQTRIAQELTKSMQQAMDEQRKQNADMAHSFPGAMPPFAAPEFAGMPFEIPEPPVTADAKVGAHVRRLKLYVDAVDIDAEAANVRVLYRAVFSYPLVRYEQRSLVVLPARGFDDFLPQKP